MKRGIIYKLISAMLCVITILNTSLPYVVKAATSVTTYTFREGTNTVTATEVTSGVKFKVTKTGVYSIQLYPFDNDYMWKYTVKKGNKYLSLAAYQEPTEDGAEPVYKLFAKDVGHFVLKEGETYTLKATNPDFLIANTTDGSVEKYVTIKLGSPYINESGTYYEADPIVKSEYTYHIKVAGQTVASHTGNAIDFARFSTLTGGDHIVDFLSGDEYQDNSIQFETETLRDTANTANTICQTNKNPATGVNEFVKTTGVKGATQKAGIFEELITAFFVNTIGNGAMFLIGVAAGESVTIDKILFNEYSRTRLAFFTEDLKDGNGIFDPAKQNPLLADSGILPKGNNPGILNKYFKRFTIIAVLAYVLILLYMGVRILLSSTGKDMAKYKKMFFDWVLGVLILFLFPYVIRYSIKINNAIVSYIGTLRDKVSMQEPVIKERPGGLGFPFNMVGDADLLESDYMSDMKQSALDSGRIVYALCWFMMIKELVTFLLIYMKRMLIVMFLIVIFPLVTISFAIDRIGDGKSQAFGNWFKEYLLNVFLQTFHAINYVVVMGVIFALGKNDVQQNFIFILIGLSYLSNGDKIMRAIFSQMKGGAGGTVKDRSETIGYALGMANMVKSSAQTLRGGMDKIGEISKRHLENRDRASKIKEAKTDNQWDSWNLRKQKKGIVIPVDKKEAEKETDADIKILLNKNSSAEMLQGAARRLRANSMAGGVAQQVYEEKMAELDPKKKAAVEELMEENDALDALENIDSLTEEEINYNLNIIMKNKKVRPKHSRGVFTDYNKKVNMAKLNQLLETKGFSEENQQKLNEILARRKAKDADAPLLERARTSIYTKGDASKMRSLRNNEKKRIQLREEVVTRQLARTDLTQTERDRYTTEQQSLRNKMTQLGIRPGAYSTKSMNEIQNDLMKLETQQAHLNSGIMNKSLGIEDEVSTTYDKNTSINTYSAEARNATGSTTLTPEQQEVIEAQAVLDGKNSGQYTVVEVMAARQKIKRAKQSTDVGVQAVLAAAEANPDTATPTGFDAKLAAMVLNAKDSDLSRATDDATARAEAEAIRDEARAMLLSDEDKGTGIYEQILEEEGFRLEHAEDGTEEIVELVEEEDIDVVINEIAETEEEAVIANAERKRQERIAREGEIITNDDELKAMKRKRFSESLAIARDAATTTATATVGAVTGFAAAGMYAGAAGSLDVSNIYHAATMATGATVKLTNMAVNTPLNTILGSKDTDFGKSNIHEVAEKQQKENEQKTAFVMQEVEERAATIERVQKNRQRLIDELARRNGGGTP